MKTETFLPVFSGFYNTIWESLTDSEDELNTINDERTALGLEPVDYDDLEVDYTSFCNEVAQQATKEVEKRLQDFVRKIEFQSVVSPKYYNYSNDSINCVITPRINAIKKYIEENYDAFSEYVKEKYTSRPGFISSYPDDADEFLDGSKYLEDEHKLGAVLDFIAQNEEITEYEIYEAVSENIGSIGCTNYQELITN